MRRSHPRGPSSRGVTVDIDGAMLGPDCVLIQRTPEGYRCVTQDEAAAIQALVVARVDDPDWLFRQCHRITKALADQNIALAQIYGMGIPIPELDRRELAKLASTAQFIKANFNPEQARDTHGRWTEEASIPANMTQAPPTTNPQSRDPKLTPGATDDAESQLAADNQRENKMVRDIVVQLRLSPEQRQKLHRAISGQGYTYQEILMEAKEMFDK